MNPASKILSDKVFGTTNKPVITPQTLVVQAFALAANCIEFSGFQEASTSLATNLASCLACERVSIGLVNKQHLHAHTLSHQGRWDKRTNLVKLVNAVMDESYDQETTVVYPVPAKNAKTKYASAHETLSNQRNSAAVCTILLANSGVITGAITLERAGDNPFQPSTIQMLELVATITGPLLETKRLNERRIGLKVWDAITETYAGYIGTENRKKRFYTIAGITLFLFLVTATGTHQVTAESSIEGSIQRTISAADDGYIAASNVRAGDTVSAGQVMAELDDSDLLLEIEQQENQRSQLEHEYKSALVESERIKVALLSVKMNQVDTQIRLLNDQLKRLQAIAPFDGIIIEGDLKQALGMPVKRGDSLFKIAPLNDYRVTLNVDEADIGFIEKKQKGVLTLTGLPHKYFPINIVNVTPVSIPKNGKNIFHVEATLIQHDSRLRPNMKGVSKISIGESNLVWIWTHKLFDWLVIKTWALMP